MLNISSKRYFIKTKKVFYKVFTDTLSLFLFMTLHMFNPLVNKLVFLNWTINRVRNIILFLKFTLLKQEVVLVYLDHLESDMEKDNF